MNFTKAKITYIDPVTGEEVEGATIDQALENTLSNGIGAIYDIITTKIDSGDPITIETCEAQVGDAINKLTKS